MILGCTRTKEEVLQKIEEYKSEISEKEWCPEDPKKLELCAMKAVMVLELLSPFEFMEGLELEKDHPIKDFHFSSNYSDKVLIQRIKYLVRGVT